MSNTQDMTLVVTPGEQGAGFPGIPGYRIQQKVGAGGMGTVYLANDDAGRPVAIKTLKFDASINPDIRARFEREGAILAALRHEHIVRLYARGVADGETFLVMEYLPNGSLSDRLRRGGLKGMDFLNVATDIANALAYAHEEGLYHRDMKPANIMFTTKGKAVLCDFGIAKIFTTSSSNSTVPGMVIGTPGYIAPEVLFNGQEYTAAADIFSFGIVLTEMAVGHEAAMKLYKGLSPGTPEARAFAGLFPRSDRAIADLAARCLDSDPSARPDADEVFMVLKRQLGKVRTASTRRFWIYAGTATVLLGALASGAGFLVRQDDKGGANAFSVQDLPANGLVFVDGKQFPDNPVTIPDPDSTIAILAPGHVGRIVRRPGRPDSPIDAGLEPLGLPSVNETERFERLISRDSQPTEVEIASVEHYPLKMLLRIKGAKASGDTTSFNRLVDNSRELAFLGDPGSALVLYLAGGLDLIPDELEKHKELMRNAALSGYALAAFYIGRHERRIDASQSEYWTDMALKNGYPPGG